MIAARHGIPAASVRQIKHRIGEKIVKYKRFLFGQGVKNPKTKSQKRKSEGGKTESGTAGKSSCNSIKKTKKGTRL
jgi:hypothetical protein